MTEDIWPYNLPIWQHSLYLKSPDGRAWAEIKKAEEVSMGNPTSGVLILSSGLTLKRCNPSFIWSDDSSFIAVPQYDGAWFVKQKLLIIEVGTGTIWKSPRLAHYIQPESFTNGTVTITLNPFHKSKSTRSYGISEIKNTFSKES